MRRRSFGFTLIELLVVVAIIALLIAILLPSLARSKAQAVRVKCAAQLKQWGMVVNLYAQENQDWFGVVWQEGPLSGPTPPKHFWNGIAVGTPELYDPEWGNMDTKANMSKYSIGMRTCPGDPLFGQYAAAGATGGTFVQATRPPVDYVMTRYYPVMASNLMWKMGQATHPNSTMLMCDSPTVQYGTTAAPVGNGTMNMYYACNTVGMAPPNPTVGDLDSEPGETLTQALQSRHLGIGNVLFLDAHVEQHPYKDYVKNIPAAASGGVNGYPPFSEAGKLWANLFP